LSNFMRSSGFFLSSNKKHLPFPERKETHLLSSQHTFEHLSMPHSWWNAIVLIRLHFLLYLFLLFLKESRLQSPASSLIVVVILNFIPFSHQSIFLFLSVVDIYFWPGLSNEMLTLQSVTFSSLNVAESPVLHWL